MAHPEQGMFRGMFGPEPWEIEAARAAAAKQEDMAIARMNPDQAGVYGSAQAGRQLGGGLRAMADVLGVPRAEDPAMDQARKIAQINKELQSSGISPSDTENYLTQLGEKLAAAGLTKEAMNVSQALQSHRNKQVDLDIKKDQVNVARMRAEAFRTGKLNYENEQIWKDADKYDSASFQKWKESVTPENKTGDHSLLKPKDAGELEEMGLNKDGEVIWKNKQGERFKDTPQGRVRTYDNPVKIKGVSGDTKIEVGGPVIKNIRETDTPAPGGMDPEASKEMIRVGKASWEGWNKKVESLKALEPALRSIEGIIAKDGPIYTGKGSEAAAALDSFGYSIANLLKIPYNTERLDNTASLKRYTSQAVLPFLAAVGGNDSNQEMEKLENAIANNTLTKTMIADSLRIARAESIRIKNEGKGFQTWLGESPENKKNPFIYWANKELGSSNIPSLPPSQDTLPKDRSKTEVKASEAVVRDVQSRPQPGALAPTAVNPPMSSAPAAVSEALITKYMAKWNLSREETIAQILKNRGQ